MTGGGLHCAAPARTGTLREFQDGFARALLETQDDSVPAPSVAVLVRQPGFAVYRNTVMKGCIDALQCNFPAVARIVGEEWFRAAASVYARANLPSLSSLIHYGDAFPGFLRAFGPAQEFPYVADVARLDRFFTEAHCAPDEAPLAASVLASLSAEEMSRAVLRPHASARWAWFDRQPAYTIWSRNRTEAGLGHGDEIQWRAEGALLLRPGGAVTSLPLDAAGCAFLEACARRASLALAAAAALEADPAADLARLMSTLLGAGAFGAMTMPERAEDE